MQSYFPKFNQFWTPPRMFYLKLSKILRTVIFTLHLWTAASEFTYDNCSVNIGREHEVRQNFRILNSEKIVLCNTLFKLTQVNSATQIVNPLSANLRKWSNTLKEFVGNLPTNCLNMFDQFVGLAFKGLTWRLATHMLMGLQLASLLACNSQVSVWQTRNSLTRKEMDL